MTGRPARLAALFGFGALAAATIACGPERDPGPTSELDAPVTPRATLLLTSEPLHLGEIVTAEVAVVTPPDHRVQVPTHPIEGLALLGAQALALERHEHYWRHRTVYRLRAEAVGESVWPPITVEVERPDGTLLPLQVAERPFEVASVQERFPERDEPFGLEELEAEAPAGGGFVPGFALGVLLSAGVAVGGWGARRVATRRAEGRAIPEREPAASLFDWTESELAEALATLDADPRRAASAGAHLLRVYMARRFGSETEAATTEELERREPALAERTLWPDFVRILHDFDDARFRPPRREPNAPEPARVRSALESSRRLIQTSRPLGRTRDA